MKKIKTISSLFCFLAISANAQNLHHKIKERNRPIANIHFELIDKLIYLPVSVNSSVPSRFILDGGSSVCVVDSSKVEPLHLTGHGYGIIHGAGSGVVKVKYCDSLVYEVAGTSTMVPRSDIINLSNAVPGQQLDGLLGYDFFLKYVVEIDYKNKTLRLYNPKSYHYAGNGSIIQIGFHKKIPYFRGRSEVNGVPVLEKEYSIDTGSSDIIDDDLILQSAGSKKEVVGGVGVGQTFTIVEGKIKTFQIGKYKLYNLDGVSGANKICGGLLSRYKVIFDYSRLSMILE